MRRRHLLALPAALLPGAAVAQGAAPGTAQTATYPNRTVRIIVPYGPGGSSDIVARILAQRATELTGHSFVVENRGGGASIPGTQAVAAAPPDGYTIGTADNALVVNPALFRERLPYDTERDLGTLGLAVTAPLLLLAHPSAPARNVAEVLAEARAQPGALGISHGGIATPTHLAAVQLQLATGLEFTQVGYRGGGPQLAGLVAGEVHYGLVAISSALGHVQGGRLRALAVTGNARSPLLPEVPTMAEAGLPSVDLVGWWGFISPAGLPPEVARRLHAVLLAPAREAAIKARLEGLGYGVVAGSPEDYAALIRREIAQWNEIVARVGIKVE
ncbi:tripartite tricarboxylate transporter substrate binding protein [Siccirubricoccus sp. G192]|uniref:Bug family tripartite tricarboxylate transporter substrate binding protein n=1 Tax=Siccirubricoccus sp. G192 TaxID=2849651 RepID=UPI001C2C42CF|nr:tripartite tricarboxylate transporter substrate binding protein [Siccirubricoccus sp. G192]MBV1798330.1 tripartite tricarboxylate transporter substrate binding protein [Siccirubricoccus sp. G192]